LAVDSLLSVSFRRQFQRRAMLSITITLRPKHQNRSSRSYNRDNGYEKWTTLFIRSAQDELLISSNNGYQ
jgi:hypothetical protein